MSSIRSGYVDGVSSGPDPPGETRSGSYSGPVQFTWAAEHYVKFGSAIPVASRPCARREPVDDGRFSHAVRAWRSRLRPSASRPSTEPEIPVTLRTLIPIGADSAATSPAHSPAAMARASQDPPRHSNSTCRSGVQQHEPGARSPDNGYLLGGFAGRSTRMQLERTAEPRSFRDLQFALQLFREQSATGTLEFVLLQNFFSSGNQTSLPFTARIGFNTAQVAASRFARRSAARCCRRAAHRWPSTSSHQYGAVTEWYFADARLSTLDVASLAPQPGCAGFSTAVASRGTARSSTCPRRSTSAQFVAQVNRTDLHGCV